MLAKELLGTAYDKDSPVDTIWRYVGGVDLDALQCQHGSDEECLKYVIEKFLRGKIGYYDIPTWRAVIWALYNANEIEIASNIKSYAEPLQGTTCMSVQIYGSYCLYPNDFRPPNLTIFFWGVYPCIFSR